jgi:hypothetical protein
MTRTWHWSVLGVPLLAVWVVALAWTGDPAYRAGFLGYGVLIFLVGVLPVVLLLTAVGAGVLAVARRLPRPGDPRRGRALAVAVAVAAITTTVAGAVLAGGGPVAGRVAPELLAWSALAVGLPLTTAAGVAWARWRPAAEPAPDVAPV